MTPFQPLMTVGAFGLELPCALPALCPAAAAALAFTVAYTAGLGTR